jgi:hypothetical protein
VNDNTVYVASGHIPVGIKDRVLALGDWFDVTDETINASDLRASVDAMKDQAMTNDPTRAARYAPGGRLLTITVARPNHGMIRFRVTFFLLTQFGRVMATHRDFTESGVVFDSGAENYRPAMPKEVFTVDPLALVRTGIQGAFAEPDSASGPPITLIQITPDKINWIDHGNCNNDGTNAWDTTPPKH